MDRKEIDKIIQRIDKVPALPQVISKVLTMMKDSKVSMSDIGKVVSMDIALSTKILQVINSAFYSLPHKIVSISQAINMLGFSSLKASIFSVSIIRTIRNTSTKQNEDVDENMFSHNALWTHGIATATISRVIARKIIPAISEEAFVGGIIHDIGKIFLEQYIHNLYELVVEEVKTKKCLFIEAEDDIIGINHSQLGYEIAKKWGLPDTFIYSIAYHHKPNSAPLEYRKLATIIHVSDILARGLLLGSGWDDKVPMIEEKAFYDLGFSNEDVQSIVEQSVEEYNNANEFLNLIKE